MSASWAPSPPWPLDPSWPEPLAVLAVVLLPLLYTVYFHPLPHRVGRAIRTALQVVLTLALLISIAFGFLSRRRTSERVKYIIWSLFLFLLIGVGIGWAMYPFSNWR